MSWRKLLDDYLNRLPKENQEKKCKYFLIGKYLHKKIIYRYPSNYRYKFYWNMNEDKLNQLENWLFEQKIIKEKNFHNCFIVNGLQEDSNKCSWLTRDIIDLVNFLTVLKVKKIITVSTKNKIDICKTIAFVFNHGIENINIKSLRDNIEKAKKNLPPLFYDIIDSLTTQ